MHQYSIIGLVISTLCYVGLVGNVAVAAAAPQSKQSVVSAGTNVAAATADTTISNTCKDKFNGCMDLMCMDDNVSGGRCLCNNKIFELEKIASSITDINLQSVTLENFGETALSDTPVTVKNKKSGLDLSMWDSDVSEFDDEDDSESDADDLVRGGALMAQSARVCGDRFPECANEISVLTAMYDASTRSDCAAYENALKKQKTDANRKLASAQSAMRTAALDKLQSANKYDLGECTIAFTECMQTTAECGTDFSKCAVLVAMDNAGTRSMTNGDTYNITGVGPGVEISASTYDVLESKRPLCDTVLKSCTSVADKVWDAFLHANAAQIKSAELIAENNVRQECIGRISDCFAKGCKDNIDPNDPDGSYDACLTRPETMMSICTVPLNSCGVDTSDVDTARAAPIWNFVVDRLASMRVDSCTSAVKECLTAEDRCGPDYSNCVGLDTDTIIRMCPYDKLVGCQQKYGDVEIRGDAVYDELATMVRGLMVNIDNKLLTHCQNALNDSVLRVCGATDNCDAVVFAGNSDLGAGSLDYGICKFYNTDAGLAIDEANCRTDVSQITDAELGRGGVQPAPLLGIVGGQIYWGMIDSDEMGQITDASAYLESALDNDVRLSGQQQLRIMDEINALQRNIDAAISAIESDNTVQYCMTGRTVPGAKILEGQTPRFPELTKSVRKMVASHALKTAADNYSKKFDALNERMLSDYVTIAGRQAEVEGKNAADARRDMARQTCIALAPLSSMPRSAEPPKNMWGTIIIIAAVAVATVLFAVFCQACLGAEVAVLTTVTSEVPLISVPMASGAMTALSTMTVVGTTTTTVTMAATAAGIAGIAAIGAAAAAAGATAIASAAQRANSEPNEMKKTDLTGHYEMKQWNYRQTVDTTFDMDTLICTKCVTTQSCDDPRNPMFGKKNCKKWSEKQTECTDVQM